MTILVKVFIIVIQCITKNATVEEIELHWTQRVIDKIYKKHSVTPEEVQEVIYEGKPFFRRGSGSGKYRRYYVLGRTQAGRYLLIVLKRVRGSVFSAVTA